MFDWEVVVLSEVRTLWWYIENSFVMAGGSALLVVRAWWVMRTWDMIWGGVVLGVQWAVWRA